MNELTSNDSAICMIAQAINEMKSVSGGIPDEKINLAELERRTGISRQRLRTLQKHGFKEAPHGNTGRSSAVTVLEGFTSIIDNLLRQGVTNSSVCFERLKENGFVGSLSSVKRYIAKHKNLVPAKRMLVSPQGNRGRRYLTAPGETYQMDWGFVDASDEISKDCRVSCFAMICHHCGMMYIEFFTNAKQENLFIGMLHAFAFMGIPKRVLTDNMKSVISRRDQYGHPLWNTDYEAFMRTVGFDTAVCKPRHPFTKGKVERLIRFVKSNFIAGRSFTDLTDLNTSALEWCSRRNSRYHGQIDDVPIRLHNDSCAETVRELEESSALLNYLCPERKISFDGFINYEGRRFGVPYTYAPKTVRVRRKGEVLYIYSSDFRTLQATHPVTWSRKDSFCPDQYDTSEPEELPTMPVRAQIQIKAPVRIEAFDKFDFEAEEDPLYD